MLALRYVAVPCGADLALQRNAFDVSKHLDDSKIAFMISGKLGASAGSMAAEPRVQGSTHPNVRLGVKAISLTPQ